ncbi:hypothetical protein [uncultured Kordia sp.]|uniref:hypothetical protein n=1 Tax=uncultured Kordia sp. TaxID=507699 RepID=UPI00261DFE89|nr:hypothetical protein [uncultured Kordia sp.]
MFNELTTTYTLKKIIKRFTSLYQSFSDLKGEKLEIIGFNGFSNISGDIRIYKK